MSIKSYIKYVCLWLIAWAGLASCTKDVQTASVNSSTESALVKLSIHTPSSSIPKATRSSATADESAVSKMKLVVLQLTGDEYRYRYMVDGQQIVQSTVDSDITTFNALLTSSDFPIKILLVANHNDVFNDIALAEDMAEESVKQMMVDSFDHRMEGELPLYGEISLPQLKADQPNSFSVTMLRAIARVDVNNNSGQNEFSDDFTIESVYIYRANDKLSIVPDAAAMQSDGKKSVKAATVPSTSGEYNAYSKRVVNNGELSIIKSYLPESLPVSDGESRTADATCVVVGGYYADDTSLSYYRIDFDSGYEGHPFGQVLRNHKYIFNIQQVNGRGWPTPGEAAENEATAITATMQIWDELTSEMWFTGDENYLGISSRIVVLDYYAGAERIETLQATVPFGIQQLDASGNPTGPVISADGGIFTTDFYKLEVTKDNTSGDDVWSLVITSLADNYTSDYTSGNFKVFTDWWTFDVEVIQEPYVSDRVGKYVRILTITDLDGDLGTTDGTFTALSGDATRKMLENTDNFSPNGTVTIGGIIVYDLKNATISSENSSDMYILEKVLNDVDVVHLPYLCSPSEKATELLIRWHRAKPNRVLIIGLDNDETNANLRSYIYEVESVNPEESNSGTWDVAEGAYELGRAYEEFGMSERFFDGPFGEVAFISMGTSKTSPVGYNNGYNAESIAPLLMIKGGPDNHEKLTHGVNVANGLVYFGESGITSGRGTAMSPSAVASGTVVTDFDRLMANLWAWIIERVSMEGSAT